MGLGLRTLEQKLTAGNDWTGVTPTTDIVRLDNIEYYLEDIQGGLFDPIPSDALYRQPPVMVRSVELKLGGQSIWTVHKRDRDGDELLIMCGTTETDFLSTEMDSFPMTVGQFLVIRSTGATAKLIARVTVQATV